jgi:hypothetical protein
MYFVRQILILGTLVAIVLTLVHLMWGESSFWSTTASVLIAHGIYWALEEKLGWRRHERS